MRLVNPVSPIQVTYLVRISTREGWKERSFTHTCAREGRERRGQQTRYGVGRWLGTSRTTGNGERGSRNEMQA